MNGDEKWLVDQGGERGVKRVNVTLVDGTTYSMDTTAFRLQIDQIRSTDHGQRIGLINYFRSSFDDVYKKPRDIAFRITVATPRIVRRKGNEEVVLTGSSPEGKKDETIKVTRRIVRPGKNGEK